MQVRRLPLCLAVLAWLALAPTSRATTVIQPSFDQMVGSADYIVRVEVNSVESSWRDNPSNPGDRYIGSRVTLTVKEIIKGTPPSPLVLDLAGGRVGEDELVIDGAPKFEAGDECILFVRGNGRTFFPVVGLMHGYFPVYRDPVTKRASVLRFNGRPLRNVQDLDPAATGPAPATASSRAMTPEAFRDRIRQQQSEILTREKLR